MKSTSCEMLGWMKHKLNQDCQEKYQQTQMYAEDATLMVESKEPVGEGERGD